MPLREFARLLNEAQTERGFARVASPSPKGELHGHAVTAMTDVWRIVQDLIATFPESGGLVDPTSHPPTPIAGTTIQEELAVIFARNPEFAIAKLRARASRVVEFAVTAYATRNATSEAYPDALARTHPYWFRRSITDHLGTGFHTALSAFFRMLGLAPLIALRDRGTLDDIGSIIDQLFELTMATATAHLDLLAHVDGLIWDSAGSTPGARQFTVAAPPLPSAVSVRSQFAHQVLMRLREPTSPFGSGEERRGCPAFHARVPRPLMLEVGAWCRDLAERWYLPLFFADTHSAKDEA